MTRKLAELDMSDCEQRVRGAIDGPSRRGYDPGNTAEISTITTSEAAVTQFRRHLFAALRKQVGSAEDIRTDSPLTEAIVRASSHPDAAPITVVPLDLLEAEPDLGPALRIACAEHPRPWDRDVVAALLITDLRERHGTLDIDEALPPWLAHWGPASAEVHALFSLWAYSELGLL